MASYAPLIGKTDVLVIRTQPLTAETIAMAAWLQIVSRHGVGFDAVDVAALLVALQGGALAAAGLESVWRLQNRQTDSDLLFLRVSGDKTGVHFCRTRSSACQTKLDTTFV